MGIVADEADAAGLLGAVDVLHGQVFVAATVEGDEVHLAVDDFVERGERLEAYDVARLQDGVHRVAADVDGAVAAGDVGYLYLAQHVLGAVGQQGLQVGSSGDVVQGDAAVVQRVGRLGRVQQLYFAAGHGAVAVVGAVAGDALAGQQPVVVYVGQAAQQQAEIDAVACHPVAQRRARDAQVLCQFVVFLQVECQFGASYDVGHVEHQVFFLFHRSEFSFPVFSGD